MHTLELTAASRHIAGIALLTIVGIEFGGWFMTQIVRGKVPMTDFQKAFARAGHAHAGRPDLFDVPGVSPLHVGRHVLSRGPAEGLLHHRIDNRHNANPDEQAAGLHQELDGIDLYH